MLYQGSCHCGHVAFEAEGEITQLMACNCSICSRKGALLWFVPRETIKLLTPDGNAASYSFGKQAIKHRFCPKCGMHPYGEGTGPDGTAMAAINARCLEDTDLTDIPVKQIDGRSL